MLNRRTFLLGATALAGVAAPAMVSPAMAQGAPPTVARGTYLIRNGAVITVDKAGVLPRADILVRDGRIEAIGPDLAAAGAETIDATDMIVMPGFVDTHYHMWSAVGRNFIGDGFGYFAAKNATSKLFEPADFYNSVMLGLVELANAGVTTVHNWSHNTRTPAHAEAELRAHRDIDAARALFARPRRPDAAQRAARFHRHRRVQRDVFRQGAGVRRAGDLWRQSARAVAERGSDLPQGHGSGAQARDADRDPRRPDRRPTA